MPDQGAYSRGGGAGRFRTGANNRRSWTPADAIMHDLQITLRDEYKKTRDPIAGALKEHLRKYADKNVDGLTPEQQTAFYLSMFAGQAWLSARRDIARRLYDADKAAIKRINENVPTAFAEGANLTEYKISGNGGKSRGGGAGRGRRNYRPLPYTQDVVTALAAAKLIHLALKTLNRAKDMRFIEKRLQSICNAAALMHMPVKDIPKHAADGLIHSVSGAMDATAEAVIRGAYDTGVYQAGLDARREGIDIEKTWLGIPDTRIRESHRHLHNTTVPLDGLFYGFSGTLRYPHDPRAPAAETYRCRCRLAVHRAGSAPKAYDGPALLPTQVAAYQKWRDDAIKAAGDDLLKLHKLGRG